jgi:predicted phosphodiesterase
MKRRQFINNLALGSAGLLLPIPLAAAKKMKSPVKFGVCADVHKDIMHDADERLLTFVQSARKEVCDFIIHLGDFCRPYDYNLSFMKVWNSFAGPTYHVLGNHDMDGGFNREQVVKYWQAKGQYYSYDVDNVHFVVLDGNDVNPSPDKASGYARYIGKEQQEWLRKDLAATRYPTIVYSHQSIENHQGVENRIEIQYIFQRANEEAGFNKVIACFSGHHHTDYYTQIEGIYYIQINSMSYSWVGEKYKRIRYSQEVDEKYPWIKYTIPYKEPLYAIVSVGPKGIKITGRKTEFVGPGPKALGMPEAKEEPIVPYISNRKLMLK